MQRRRSRRWRGRNGLRGFFFANGVQVGGSRSGVELDRAGELAVVFLQETQDAVDLDVLLGLKGASLEEESILASLS